MPGLQYGEIQNVDKVWTVLYWVTTMLYETSIIWNCLQYCAAYHEWKIDGEQYLTDEYEYKVMAKWFSYTNPKIYHFRRIKWSHNVWPQPY